MKHWRPHRPMRLPRGPIAWDWLVVLALAFGLLVVLRRNAERAEAERRYRELQAEIQRQTAGPR